MPLIVGEVALKISEALQTGLLESAARSTMMSRFEPHEGWTLPCRKSCSRGPVAFNEEGLLELARHDPASPAHRMLLALDIQGSVNELALAASLKWLSERHESARSAFVWGPGGWRRVVYRSAEPRFDVIDVSRASDPKAAASAVIDTAWRTPADYHKPPLAQALLVKTAADRFVLATITEHVVIDGISAPTYLGELTMAYNALCAGGAPPPLPPPRQPREHLADVEALLEPFRANPLPRPAYPDNGFVLRADPSRPGDRAPGGASFLGTLGVTDDIARVARQAGVAQSVPVIAATAMGLAAISGRSDVAFTVTRSGRRTDAARGIVGYLAWGDTYFAQEDDRATEADGPRDAAMMAAALRRAQTFLADREPWRMLYNPRVAPPSRRIVLNINHWLGFDVPLEGLKTTLRVDLESEIVMWPVHDLLVQIYPTPGPMLIWVRYRRSWLEEATVQRLVSAMASALRAMVDLTPA